MRWWLCVLLVVFEFCFADIHIDSRKYAFIVDPKEFEGEDSVGRLLLAQKLFVDMASLGANIPGFSVQLQSGGEEIIHENYYDDVHSAIERRRRAIIFRHYVTSYRGKTNELSVEIYSADPVYARQKLKRAKNMTFSDELRLNTRVFTASFQYAQKALLSQTISPMTFADIYYYFPDNNLYSQFAITGATTIVVSKDIFRYSVIRIGRISGANATFVLDFDYKTFEDMKVNHDLQLVQFHFIVYDDSYTLLDNGFTYFQSAAMTKWSNEKTQILSVTLSGWVIFVIILAIFVAILVASLIAFCVGKRRGAYQNLL